jgi:hypothetical protein
MSFSSLTNNAQTGLMTIVIYIVLVANDETALSKHGCGSPGSWLAWYAEFFRLQTLCLPHSFHYSAAHSSPSAFFILHHITFLYHSHTQNLIEPGNLYCT